MSSTQCESTDPCDVWGILGGMGPLASAEFVNTIYQEVIGGKEQEAPSVILLSDPKMPDRTEFLLDGRSEVLLQRLTAGVEALVAIGATRVIVCCMTIHPLIQRLHPHLREKIVSLLDVTLEAVLRSSAEHLLLCTVGTRRLQLFQKHELWNQVQNQVILPDENDQRIIHEMLYAIKGQTEAKSYLSIVQGLMNKYAVQSYIAGCTEMHIVAKAQEKASGRDRREFCLDPLTEILPLINRSVPITAAALSTRS
jgi:aspartate racemase